MRPYGSPQELQERRFRAISLLKEGYQPVDIAQIIKVDRRSIRRWNATYKKEGQKGIEANPSSGRPPKLNVKDKKKLEKALLKGSMVAGFNTDLWTCPRVARLVEKLFGVSYHAHHVSKLLHSLGWTPQKPQRVAKERDEKEIRRLDKNCLHRRKRFTYGTRRS